MAPTIAIVGRPNVGKSSLFNRLTHTRAALVHDTSGVTRDRLYGQIRAGNRRFHLIDTGGLVPGHEDSIEDHIRDQVEIALDEADLVLFVVDAQSGRTPMDEEVSAALRPKGLPTVLVVNKVDGHEHAPTVEDFRSLGIDEMIGFSALHGYNSSELVDLIEERLPPREDDEDEEDPDRPLRVAFVGKPNVGKSSLINHLVEHDRLIVSDVAGTTRESIEVPFQLGEGGRPVVLIDTAGLRRRSKVKPGVEKLMRVTTERAIRMADIVVLMLDGSEPLTHQDKHIAGLVKDARKPGLLVVNKIDTFASVHQNLLMWFEDLDYDMSWYDYAPRIAVSAHDGRGVRDLLEALEAMRSRFDYRIPTPRLNKILREALLVRPPPTRRGRSLNILYAHQRREFPASFTVKVNDPALVHFSFLRYLENTLRQYGEFEGFPMVLRFLARGESAKQDKKKRIFEEALEEEASAPEAQPGATLDERLITRVPQRRKQRKKISIRTPSAPLAKPAKKKPPGKKPASRKSPGKGAPSKGTASKRTSNRGAARRKGPTR